MAELKIRSAVVDLKYFGKKKKRILSVQCYKKWYSIRHVSQYIKNKGKSITKLKKKNVVSNWHMTDVACFHRAAIMDFLLTLPEHRGPCISIKDH